MLLFFEQPFTPASIGGNSLKAWYDFSNSSYLTLSATAITQALDRSGNGNHTSVQSTGTKRPTFTTGALNGLSVASFDNGDTLSFSSKPTLFAVPNGANTVFTVSKRADEPGVADYVFSLNEGAGNTSGRLRSFFAGTAGSIAYASRTASNNSVNSTGNTNTNYNIIVGRRSSTTQAISVNGGSETTNASGEDESGIDGGWVGSNADSDSYLNGNIAEILVYNRSLSASEISQVAIYLADKWGLYYPGARWLNAFSAVEQELIASQKLTLEVATALFNSVVAWYRMRSSSLTLSSTAITQMLDVSGNGNHTSVQGTSTMRPTFNATGLNSLGTAEFDGGDRLVLPQAVLNIANGSTTTFAVAERSAEDATNDPIYSIGTSTNNKNLFLYATTAGNITYRNNSAASGGATITGITNTDWNVITGRRSGSTSAIAVNGSAETTAATATDAGTVDNGYVGGGLNSLFLTGGIAELIFFNASLSAAQIDIMEAWLGTQYNITIA